MAAPMALRCCKSLPLVVILGATGTGKSKLAIEIASKFNGEIISADSMQVYKSLDIITNKVTQAEREAAPHHLIDFLDPLWSYTVVDFRNKAIGIIEGLLNKGKLPVIVGGTNYYIESLLWRVLVKPESQQSGKLTFESRNVVLKDIIISHMSDPRNETINEEEKTKLDSLLTKVSANSQSEEVSTEDMYSCLELVDRARAKMLHPKDRRKIERSLQVYQTHLKPHSELIEEQKQLHGGSSLGGPLRYPRTCVLWLQCDQQVLDERLDSRVDDMINCGLVREMQEFHSSYNRHRLEQNLEADYTRGIFQSIGFKEFHRYLVMSPEEQQSKKGQKLFAEGLWLMKQVTKRYSRRQKKWIMQRFLSTPDRQVPPIYGLDATDVSQWEHLVRDRAFDIVEDCLEERAVRHAPLPTVENKGNVHQLFTCDVCNVSTVGSITWEAHLKSRKHYKMAKHKKKQEAAENGDTAAAHLKSRKHYKMAKHKKKQEAAENGDTAAGESTIG
ncbi:tRNA dimethylallyltransferase isoform X2 [Ixodes scapularis]